MLRDVPFLKPHHIDEPIVEKLLKMPPQQAFDALAELGRNNLGTVSDCDWTQLWCGSVWVWAMDLTLWIRAWQLHPCLGVMRA